MTAKEKFIEGPRNFIVFSVTLKQKKLFSQRKIFQKLTKEVKKIKKKLGLTLLAILLVIGSTSVVVAEEETSEVTVDVDSSVQMDVRPSALDFTDSGEGSALEPGAVREISDGGYEHLELENIGSEVLDNIYVEATAHDNNPFGDDTANHHDTGNFVTVSTDTAFGTYDIDGLVEVEENHYVNRAEFVEDLYPTYLNVEEDEDVTVDATEITNDEQQVGRLRVGDVEYFYVVYTDSTTGATNVGLRVGQSPHTSEELGTTDFTDDGDDYFEAEISDNDAVSNVYYIGSLDLVSFDTSDYNGGPVLDGSSADFTETDLEESQDSTEVRNYAHYFDTANENTVRAAVNVAPESPDGSWDLTEEDDRSGIQYIVSASSSDEGLQPGQNLPVDVGVQVPLGVDNTRVSAGTVTVQAEQFQ